MKLVWTKTKSNDVIAWAFKEPASHVAILFFDSIIFHSTFSGVDILSKNDFLANRNIVFEKDFSISGDDEQTLLLFFSANETHKKYDWKFFFWLFWRAFLLQVFGKQLPSTVERQDPRHIICTEVLDLLPDHVAPRYDRTKAVTPYRLYLQLKDA